VASFARDPATGLLSPFGPCFSASDAACERMPEIERAGFVALSPDERFLLVNAPSGDRLVALARLGQPGPVRIVTRRVTARRDGQIVLRVRCAATTVPGGCVGTLRLTVRDLVGGGVLPRSTAGTYALNPGRTGRVTLTLQQGVVPAGGSQRLLAVAVSHDPTGGRTAAASATVVVRRPAG
jgi:hypothetical protein